MKQCTRQSCKLQGQLQSLNEFYLVKNKKDGLDSWCKTCKSEVGCEYSKVQRQNNHEAILKQEHIKRQMPKGKFKLYRDKAKERNLAFNLTFNEFMLFWQKPCHYCGFDVLTIGLDRKDNTLGYTVENVVSCCPECNTAKFDLFTYKEMVSIIGRAIAEVKRNRLLKENTQ